MSVPSTNALRGQGLGNHVNPFTFTGTTTMESLPPRPVQQAYTTTITPDFFNFDYNSGKPPGNFYYEQANTSDYMGGYSENSMFQNEIAWTYNDPTTNNMNQHVSPRHQPVQRAFTCLNRHVLAAGGASAKEIKDNALAQFQQKIAIVGMVDQDLKVHAHRNNFPTTACVIGGLVTVTNVSSDSVHKGDVVLWDIPDKEVVKAQNGGRAVIILRPQRNRDVREYIEQKTRDGAAADWLQPGNYAAAGRLPQMLERFYKQYNAEMSDRVVGIAQGPAAPGSSYEMLLRPIL